jgi:hypothetical protein
VRSVSPDLKQFVLRFIVVAGAGMFAGYLSWGSFIFVSTMMCFQFTQNSITAGLSYALFKRTSALNSFLILFSWYLIFTALEAFSNRWMYVLNLTYIAGISSAVYLYLYLIDKSILLGPLRRVAALTVAIGMVNTLHVVVLVLMSVRWSYFNNPQFMSHVLNTCWFNFQTGIIIGLAAGIGVEAVDHSLIQRVLAALKSWALDSDAAD